MIVVEYLYFFRYNLNTIMHYLVSKVKNSKGLLEINGRTEENEQMHERNRYEKSSLTSCDWFNTYDE